MFFVSPIEVAIDALTAGGVIGVVRVVEAEAFQGTEMGLNGVEPAGIGRCRDEDDVVLLREILETLMPMGGQVVLDEVDARFLWITSPQPFPGDQEVATGFALVNGAGQTIVMDIVEGEQLFRSLLALVGRPQAARMFLSGPADSGHRLEFHRTKLIETDHSRL